MTSFLSPSPTPDTPRIFVLLPTGTKILVPTPPQPTVSAPITVHDIHETALIRAQRFGVQGTVENTVLETTGSGSPVALSGEDALLDVLDLTDDNTFSLRVVEWWDRRVETVKAATIPDVGSSDLEERLNDVMIESPPPLKQTGDGPVYVRWITLEDAVEYLQLRKIPVDDCPFPEDTTLLEFYHEAVSRLCRRPQKGACLDPKKVNLYLKECALHAENSTSTLGGMGLSGSRNAPLDIFVEFTGPETRKTLEQLTTSTDPSELWSFDSSRRGICTLVTSLQILIHELEQKRCTIDGILGVLLNLTHFPPVLLAFRHLYQTGLKGTTPAGPILLVAAAFHAICRKMVPSFLSQTTDSLLEASRQVTAWIVSLWPSVRAQGTLAKPVEIQDITTEQHGASPMLYSFEHEVPSKGSTTTKISVMLNDDNPALARILALAINNGYSPGRDFYFTKDTPSWNEFLDHWLTPTPAQSEFDHLIETTNVRGAFRMIGPLQLGKCLAAELPMITLSAAGYVSRYDQEDYECGEKTFYMWNVLEKKVDLPHTDSGQFISQKLEPVIADRKKEHAWELDAWADWSDVTDFGTPDEAVVICVDVSSSMNGIMGRDWLPTQDGGGLMPSRLTEVKEFFKNFALRISALNLATNLGLVTFAGRSSVKVQQGLTPLHLNFHQKLESINADGSTAINDALAKGVEMLKEIRDKHPKTKSRIVLLTDGEDNSSSFSAPDAAKKLYDNDVVLDAVVIGSDFTSDLFKMARITGGYAFAPKTQAALFQIFLLETMVDIRTRPDLVRIPQHTTKTTWDTFTPKKADMADPYDFPPCRPHPNLDDYFIALKDADRFLTYVSRRPVASFESVISDSIRAEVPAGLNASNMASANTSNTRILLAEVKAMIEHPHDDIDVYVSESNMGFWKVVMQGPPASPYEYGVFLLYVEIGNEFPRRPPNARFVTPILHPNITKVGLSRAFPGFWMALTYNSTAAYAILFSTANGRHRRGYIRSSNIYTAY